MRAPDFRGQRVDRYYFTDLIGYGGSGIVYRAVDMSSDHHRPYAIKWLTKRVPHYQWNQMVKEIRLQKAVNGFPHVLKLRHIVEENDCLFLVLDLCETNMAKEIHHRTYWRNDALIKKAFLGVVNGLMECHSQHIYHRDLKPENIMCKAGGTGIKIGDFGLATERRYCRDGGCGTFNYISPECWASDSRHPYDSKLTDIWSLGIVLFEMVTTRYPWEAAIPTDKEFRAFMDNEEFLYQTHPISERLSILLKWILHPVPTMRLTLSNIRDRVQEMDTFYKWRLPPNTTTTSFPESEQTYVELGDSPEKKKNKALEWFRGRGLEKMKGGR